MIITFKKTMTFLLSFFCLTIFLPVHSNLLELVQQCNSITEISQDNALTSELFRGFEATFHYPERYLKICQAAIPNKQFLSNPHVKFTQWKMNDVFIEIEPVDMLLIKNLDSYVHISYELKMFAKNVNKYIAIFYNPHSEISEEFSNPNNPIDYPDSIDKTKKGVYVAIEDFLLNNPEWRLSFTTSTNIQLAVLERVDFSLIHEYISDPELDEYLNNKLILCTGPAYGRYDMLKSHTEADLDIIPFKKVFLTTNDPKNVDITFNGRKPDSCQLISPPLGKQLDCYNCIISTMQAAIRDPEVLDDDVILFMHESVFLNDMNLVKRALKKMLTDVEIIRRMGMFGPPTDHFYVKVSAIREIVKDYPYVDGTIYCCEYEFRDKILSRIPRQCILPTGHSLWRSTQLGSYHFYPHGITTSQVDGWQKPWWDKSNYYDLFK